MDRVFRELTEEDRANKIIEALNRNGYDKNLLEKSLSIIHQTVIKDVLQ